MLPSNVPKEDKRKLKTQKLLNMAMFSLLKTHNFKKITIENICDEALTGRATFYAHFTDKYDLLKFWLPSFWHHEIKNGDNYKEIEITVNQFVRENEPIIINILDGADNRTLQALSDYLYSALVISGEKYINGKITPRYAVASNIYIGGIVNYFVWQVENGFPSNVPIMNKDLYALIKRFQAWDENDGGFVND